MLIIFNSNYYHYGRGHCALNKSMTLAYRWDISCSLQSWLHPIKSNETFTSRFEVNIILNKIINKTIANFAIVPQFLKNKNLSVLSALYAASFIKIRTCSASCCVLVVLTKWVAGPDADRDPPFGDPWYTYSHAYSNILLPTLHSNL